jgi:type I restriction enzyme, S subunit
MLGLIIGSYTDLITASGFVNKWDVPIFASDCSTVEPKDETQLPQFIYYYLMSQQQFIYDNFRSGAAQPHVYARDLETLYYPIIPLAEQQRIVAKLDAAFAEIDRAVESYEDSVSNAKDCLSKVRASRVTEVLSSSRTAKLGSLASLKNGLNYNKSEKGYSVKILGVGDFGNRFSIGTEDLKVIETNSPVSTDYHLEHGDIVFVRSNGNKQLIGRSIVIENPSEPATFSGFCIRCRIETADMSPLFLCHYLKSRVVRDKLISEGGGANISNLNQKMLADIDVPLLTQHEQISLIRWIEELEKNFEDFVATLNKRVQLADNLKSAILAQELQPPQSEAA